MKVVDEFLSYFQSLDVRLWVDGEQLHYNAPEGTLTPTLKSQLRERKSEIIEFLQRADFASSFSVKPILPVPRDTDLPLSSSQQRLWFLQQLEPDNPFYNEHGAIQLTGSLDVAALEQSLNGIVQRHEALRTTFKIVKGRPVQVIAPNLTLTLPVVNLCQLPEPEQKAEVQGLSIEQSQRPFDLVQGPLLRWTLLQLGEQQYMLLFTMHHIIYDGWSLDVLIRELSALYQVFSTGKPTLLPELPIQYADFAVWQRQELQGEKLESQLSYWKQQLNNAPPLLPLPTDRPRPPVQTYRGSTQSFLLPKSLTEAFKAVGRKAEATLFMTLLAAFKILLYRYTGQEDIIVGSPIANRNRADIEGLIGFFVNTLVLRTDFSGNPTFEELLGRVRKMTMGAYDNQDLPFEKLVEELQPERDTNYNPLFQVSFTLQNTPEVNFELPGLTLTPVNVERTRALFDLRLDITETDSGLEGFWEYNTDLFDAATMSRMSGHLQTLLEAIVENPQQRVDQLPLLSEAQQHQLLVEWNDTESEYPSDKCIHQLFEAQVQKTPLSVAVVFENQQLTYQQLNQRANQLAHHLQSLGVKAEVLVGICVERSLEMVVGLLGILKAGGAYVPLDPSYPQERLSYMLADSGVEVLLTQRSLLESLPQNQAQTVYLDTDWGAIEQQSQENLDAGVDSDNLAYAIYTSGSTGQPKGVLNTHQGIHNRLLWMQHTYQLTSSDRVVQKTPFSFDVSVWEFFWPLLTGARIVVALPEGHKDSTYLVNLISQEQITTIHFVPSMLQVFLQEPNLENCRCLQRVFCSGEALPFELTQRFFSKLECELHNLYGPTEAAIDVTFWQCQPQDNLQKVPIGRPITNTQIYILDKHLQPVPISVPGELYIGGDGLARGYLNRPELTQEKFIPNPFDNSKSERLYKTGDLVRYLSDGNIEFLGRIDHQVKIRGFRIELGEIESLLNTHPQIQQAIVIATEDIAANKRLVAYIVTSEESLTNNQLREFLLSKLPEYMVPSAFVTLGTLPLTPNGKVDRKALPAPDGEITREQEYVAPRTPSEVIIANIFASVLGVQNVGIQDNFFELGGHSLLATQLISRLRVALDIEIPLRKVFESPTVAQLEPTLTQLRTSNEGLTLPPIQPRSDSEQLPLSWAQERLWFLNQLEGSSAAYNMPGAVRITGNLDVNALQQALSEIVRRHEVLRTSFQTVNGTPIQVIHPEATLNINVVDLGRLEVTERETVLHQQVQLEAITPFDLELAPLIRCSLLQLNAREYVLLLTMHHIVSDGWSIGVFIQELSSLYQAFCAGEPSPLAELPIQYSDFAVWQRQWLSGEVLENQLNYWLSQLQGAPELLQLPTDHSRPSVPTYRGSTQSFSLNTDLTQKLQALSRESGTTLFMTLLAAFATLLYRYSGQEDILIGSPIANRHRREIESLIGFFVNTLVLRTRFKDNPSIKDLLARVRETTLKAYEYQDVPFEQLVEALQPQRSLSHSPLFQVMFVLQNALIGEVELPGVTLTQLGRESTIAKFDLTLSITETAQGLVGEWEYNTDLFDGSTIERMTAHFQNLLSAVVENPQQRIDQLPLLSETEQHQLLREWNQTQADYPKDVCIHQLFEAQVEKTPLSVAVVFEEQQLTYRELNTRANQVAHHLRSLGVKPEVLVGICVERSLEMVVGLLGILKAGGAYVPLDPAYPKERLAFMLEDAQVPVLLTQQPLLDQLPEHQAQVVCLDTDWAVIVQESQENPVNQTKAKNLAYLIYTSGSTGAPKGVMIEHHSLVNYTTATCLEYELEPSDRILQFASISFDVAAEEIFPSLVQGATLVLRTDEMLSSVPKLLQQSRNVGLTVLNLPTSFWHQVTAELSRANLALPEALRLVVIGSERALPDYLKTWQQQVNQRVRLINCYGPTETTIGATTCDLSGSRAIEAAGRELPIGKALHNIQTYVLDSDLHPVPIGVPGELYVGGLGVARGYLNRPELTAETFIPNPYSSETEARLYKTGDLVRYRPDGNLEYLGRIDAQVKVRGFRIELGEIEAVLSQHPAVRETVVLAQENVHGDKCLVAYVVTEQQPIPFMSDLRRFLKEKLPGYMVPAVFVQLEALPLTPNGKIDHKALPAPDTTRPELDKAFVAPCTPVEIKLVEIWAKVLGVEQVGIYDNFFELGGDSILTIQIVARANQAGLQLTPKQLFEHQTIAELAALAITQKALQAEQGLVTGAVSLMPIQKWFFEQNLPDPHHYNQAVLLEARQALDLALLEQALRHLLLHHDALRLRFEQIESGWQQVQSSPDVSLLLTRWDFSALAEAEQKSALEATATELQTSLNLSTGPLVQVGFFDLGVRQPSRLLLVIHHLVVDGVSWRILLEDLQTAYQQLSRGETVRLPAKTTSFQQWSRKLQEYSRSDALQQEKDYWLAEFWKQSIPLPVDWPGGENIIAAEDSVSSTLSFPETQALLKEVPKAYNTQINDILLTALVQAFAHWTGERALLIDLEGHGREEIVDDVDLSRTVGWFTSVFPVLLNLKDASNPGDALKVVKEQLRNIPNQGIGYGVLRYLSDDQGITEQLSTLPQAEVIFNYLGQFDQTLAESSWMGFAQESSGLAHSLRGKRCHLLEINGLVSGGQLQLSWSYSQEVHRRSTIEALAKSFVERLQAIITHCQSPEAGGFTPSDFSEAQLSQQELDQFLAKINRRR